MNLFNNFKEAIFYKTDSELELQINKIKKELEKNPNNSLLKKKLLLCELGLKGEKEIEFELKNSNIGMYVLHDINMEFEDLKAQIDYIVITPAKVYFIECKNLAGNITVNNNGEFSREWSYNGNKIKEGIYSPLRQAERHIEIYKNIWSSKNKGLINKIKYNNMDNWIVPLVVMANSKNILNTKYAPKEIRQKVIKSDTLIKYIQNDISKTDKAYLWNKKYMETYANAILNNYHVNIKEKNIIVNDNTKTSNDLIKDKLIEFRKSKSSKMNIPAFYVFTNEELEQLLIKRLTSIEELINTKILSQIKIKTHGKEIIDILNNLEN